MSISALPSAPRRTLSTGATTIYAAVTAISFSAASSAPTPLYHLYQEAMHLSPLTVTVIFAAYAFALMVTLLTVARLSDFVGRRPMILAGLLFSAAALVLFITATSPLLLILARLVQGVAVGIALTTLGATMLDTDRQNGALYNSITVFLGLTIGSLLAGVLVAFAPLPTQLVYIVLLVVMGIEAAVLIVLPETATKRAGALASLRPRVKVPAAARPVLLRLMPLNIASWALGGFYLSLMPTLVSVATHTASPFIGAGVVSALMLTAAIAVPSLRRRQPAQLLVISMTLLATGIALTLLGAGLQSAAVMVGGTVVAGFGFGASYSGVLRTLLPLADDTDRAGLLATYFVTSYLAFSLPAIAAGLLAPVLGLVATGYLYGAVLIGLIALSSLAMRHPHVRECAMGA